MKESVRIEREGENLQLLSTIYRDRLIVFQRALVGVHDERYVWVPEKRDFAEESKRGDFIRSRLSSLGGFLPVFHMP